MRGRAFSSAARGSRSLPLPPQIRGSPLLPRRSCLSPRLEGARRAAAGGRGPVPGRALLLTPLPFSPPVEPPELQHHVIRDLPGRGGLEASCFLLGRAHRLPAPRGRGFKPKKIPLWLFLLCFFFFFILREVIFYSDFILKEKHKRKKK